MNTDIVLFFAGLVFACGLVYAAAYFADGRRNVVLALLLAAGLLALLINELVHNGERQSLRASTYAEAVGKPLLVIGDPHNGIASQQRAT